MITYREATSADAESIAQLHSLSWQQNYRGIWSDGFLDNYVVENRRTVWQERLIQPGENQYVIVALSGETICGFACAYSHDDAIGGTLLDNLHVHKQHKGQGIGTELIRQTATWAYREQAESSFYLWVLVKNISARTFYEGLGAINQEEVSVENPDGSFSDCCRYVWPDITTLL
ncbi:GNAT family N-acetyltransferase [Spirosoma sp. BT702]|uniref:GNAT family N-acetyltransferase n=1 Tax=Spirosoma profusum TaxID=2771354 RepID=A0A926XXJ2_9BACT|nr:GNAT family N-acetyltransferase [Spirosoma profusum]MBD2702547.1 GNAT family N-acetyltransferase [Spirosoma profusum]